MQQRLTTLTTQIAQALQAKHYLLATAESCTGGWVSQVLTSLAGSSVWFDCGFVTYSNAAKQAMLGVTADVLAKQGAVSLATAEQMAQGALRHSRADVALAITGIAGPAGGTPDKPVGTVCFAWASKQNVQSKQQVFTGDRKAIRFQAVEYALQELILLL